MKYCIGCAIVCVVGWDMKSWYIWNLLELRLEYGTRHVYGIVWNMNLKLWNVYRLTSSNVYGIWNMKRILPARGPGPVLKLLPGKLIIRHFGWQIFLVSRWCLHYRRLGDHTVTVTRKEIGRRKKTNFGSSAGSRCHRRCGDKRTSLRDRRSKLPPSSSWIVPRRAQSWYIGAAPIFKVSFLRRTCHLHQLRLENMITSIQVYSGQSKNKQLIIAASSLCHYHDDSDQCHSVLQGNSSGWPLRVSSSSPFQ